ncbi:YjjG family noncanonical pyrimidine nucleotidase [uncultured Muribaculum sp.]|uniref:YjjG family noncanonical pyrimidine nucleotidase n=1 Tax=uncultured Muribaculum sp. TaxID=1918613 RepID=UPI0026EBA8B7|nr:YjjG family noncanonical pyrimidine nucleotidase [uncultured Muribaculum sp.]
MIYDGQDIDMVWIDLDDTLIDFKGASRQALRQIYADERLDRFFPSPKAWETSYEKHNYHLWQLYSGAQVDQATLRMERFRLPLTETDVADEIARAMSTRMDPVYLGYLAEASVLLPGAMPLIESLKGMGLPIGILSNGFTEVQEHKLRVTGLDKVIDIMVLSDEIGINKPNVALFDHAMKRAGQSVPSAQLMIGDNATTDIAGAISAGWNAILYDRSLPLLHTRGKGYHMVSDLEHIPFLLSHND